MEAGDFAAAVGHFDFVVMNETSDVPLSCIEQCVNCHVRCVDLAVDYLVDAARRPEATKHLDRADQLQKTLEGLGETSERLALRGSLEKRRAMISTGTDRKDALMRMRDTYLASWKRAIAAQAGPSAEAYGLMNAATGEAVLRWRSTP